MPNLANIEPADLNFPESYVEFRECQIEAAQFVIDSPQRVIALCLPTGSGKSALPLLLSKATGWRTVVLTQTKGLEDQYQTVFDPQIYDMRGKNNYTCADKPYTSCRYGKHEGCRFHKKISTPEGEAELVDPKCTYEAARKTMQWQKRVVSNYAYWIRANQFTKGFEPSVKEGQNPVQLLVLDEGHAADEALAKSLQVNLNESWLGEMGFGPKHYPQLSFNLDEWAGWAKGIIPKVKVMAESASASYRLKHTTDLRDRIRHLEDFEESLARVERMTSKDWVLERTDGTNQGRKWVFDCVWPAAWVESRLFCGVPKVVVMSGTLNRQIRVRLGVKKENFEFRSWPLQFPASATQIYHVRTVRMNSKIDKAGLDKWVKRTDEVLDAEYEVGHQGLILPVSYERQQHLLDHSRWNHTFVANTKDPESDTAVEVYEKFITGQSEKHKVKGKLGGVALVSPSFGMGWDFKHCAARFSIIAKLPYRNFMSKVVKARLVRDKRYTDTLCVQDLYQAIGRIVRDFDDWGRCYIIDDSIVYLMRVAGDLAPEGYRIVHVNEVPKARVK